ncbi:acetyl-CoA C-acyltransferase [Streptomyces sp. NPDC004838]
MREAVVCEPVRTPVGAFGGALRDVAAQELGAVVVREVMERTGLPPEAVDDVVLGHGYPSMDAPAIGRVAALDAGLPLSVGGMQLDRRCGSGLQAVLVAAMQVQTGVSDVVLAGGAESMSNAPFFSTAMRWGARSGPGVMLHDSITRGRLTAGGRRYPLPGGMIETAEAMREKYRISREEQDEYAVRSHHRAAVAAAEGRFDDEIVPVTVPGRKSETLVEHDEHIRPGTSVEQLARLRPVMLGEDPDATVTAGNASGQNDGTAVCVVTHPARAAELGLRPLVRLVSWGLSGTEPRMHRPAVGPLSTPVRGTVDGPERDSRHRPGLRTGRGRTAPGPARDGACRPAFWDRFAGHGFPDRSVCATGTFRVFYAAWDRVDRSVRGACRAGAAGLVTTRRPSRRGQRRRAPIAPAPARTARTDQAREKPAFVPSHPAIG